MNIAVGSTNPIKAKAVEDACRELGLKACLTVVNVGSCVSLQPVGQEETERGARYRARVARDRAPGTFSIGMENGIREIAPDRWEDWAVIVAIHPNRTEVLVNSLAVAVPVDVVKEAQSRGFTTTTVGAVLAEHYGCFADDPHAFLTVGARSRRSILKDAIIAALSPFTQAEGFRQWKPRTR